MMCQKWQEGTKKVAFPFNDDPQKTMGRFNVDFVSYLKNKSRKIDEKDKHTSVLVEYLVYLVSCEQVISKISKKLYYTKYQVSK